MMIDNPDNTRYGFIVCMILLAIFFVFGGVGSCMYYMPQYKVYHQRMAGEAELARANYSKQVAVQTAIAKNAAAVYEAQAEITRAGGVAQANRIIAGSITEPYLRYLFVNGLEHTQNQIIYVPTEGQLPILEAGRRNTQPAPAEKP